MKGFSTIVFTFLIAFSSHADSGTKKSFFILKNSNKSERKLKKKLSYLKESVKEILEIKLNNNIVIIKWKSKPKDFNIINRFAAVTANRTIGEKVNLLSVTSSHKDWDLQNYQICKTVSQYVRIIKSNCK